jgi:hypothetical protein
MMTTTDTNRQHTIAGGTYAEHVAAPATYPLT